MKVVRGTHDTFAGTITFANGIKANFRDQVLRDAFEGTIVWSHKEPNCSATVSQVYLGPASVHYRKPPTGQAKPQPQGAIVMIQREEQYAGLVLQDPIGVCGRHCHKSHVSGVVACLLKAREEPLPQAAFKPGFKQDGIAIQTQVGHLHIGTNLRMYSRFETVQTDLCETERKVLHGRLQDLAGNANPYSLLDLYGPGHSVHVMGAAVYVGRCVAIEASKAEFANCTQEIPVAVNGTVRFADPLTWTLTDFPTITPCSDLTPTRWKIHDKWYCSTPHPHECGAPGRLNLSVHAYRSLGDFTAGMGKNLFSPSQQEKHRTFLQALSARNPVQASFANNAVNNRRAINGQTALGFPLSPDDLSNIRLNVFDHLFPLLPRLGEFMNVLTGAFMVIFLVKLACGCLLRVFYLYQQRGFGWWLAGALWGTAFTLIKAPFEVVRGVGRQIVAGDYPIVPPHQDQWNLEREVRGARGSGGGASADAKLLEAEEGRGPDGAPIYNPPPVPGASSITRQENLYAVPTRVTSVRGARPEAGGDGQQPRTYPLLPRVHEEKEGRK